MACVDAIGRSMLSRYVEYATVFIDLCNDLHHIQHVKGAKKLEKRIQVELKFLKTLKNKDIKTQENQLKSSNLNHYAGLVHAAVNCSKLSGILYVVPSSSEDSRLVVDIVSESGHCWMKVVARKAQALHLMWAGQGQFGERDLIKQAIEFVACAQANPVNYIPPKVHFAFYNGVTLPMAEVLEKMGIIVWGQRVEVDKEIEQKLFELDSYFYDESDEELEGKKKNEQHSAETTDLISVSDSDNESTSLFPTNSQSSVKPDLVTDSVSETNILSCELLKFAPDYKLLREQGEVEETSSVETDKVNLDITTLITLVSNVCHGGCNYVFREKILTQQATDERENPCLQTIMNYMTGKKLYACKAAVDDLWKILETLGGQDECRRAEELLKNITVIEDQPSDRASGLPEMGKIKSRSKVIFGTGDRIQSITMTANFGFVRAAEHQGVKFAVFLHPSRALTQQKEKDAKKIV